MGDFVMTDTSEIKCYTCKYGGHYVAEPTWPEPKECELCCGDDPGVFKRYEPACEEEEEDHA